MLNKISNKLKQLQKLSTEGMNPLYIGLALVISFQLYLSAYEERIKTITIIKENSKPRISYTQVDVEYCLEEPYSNDPYDTAGRTFVKVISENVSSKGTYIQYKYLFDSGYSIPTSANKSMFSEWLLVECRSKL